MLRSDLGWESSGSCRLSPKKAQRAHSQQHIGRAICKSLKSPKVQQVQQTLIMVSGTLLSTLHGK